MLCAECDVNVLMCAQTNNEDTNLMSQFLTHNVSDRRRCSLSESAVISLLYSMLAMRFHAADCKHCCVSQLLAQVWDFFIFFR